MTLCWKGWFIGIYTWHIRELFFRSIMGVCHSCIYQNVCYVCFFCHMVRFVLILLSIFVERSLFLDCLFSFKLGLILWQFTDTVF